MADDLRQFEPIDWSCTDGGGYRDPYRTEGVFSMPKNILLWVGVGLAVWWFFLRGR